MISNLLLSLNEATILDSSLQLTILIQERYKELHAQIRNVFSATM